MTLPALDLELSSASPPPDGAIAPPNGDGTAEPAPASDAAAAKSSGSEAAPAKPPAASLVSIAIKSKSGGSTKAGDLTRLFELAHRQPRPSIAPSDMSPVEAAPTPGFESAAQPIPAAFSSIETPIAQVESEPGPLETAPAPVAFEAAHPVEPAAVLEAIEPSFPLMLAPPAAPPVEDAAPAATAPDPAPAAEAAIDAVPDWLRTAPEPLETPEPLKVAFVPADEIGAAHTPDAAPADDQPVAASASVAEPMPAPVEMPAAAEPPPVVVALAEPPAVVASAEPLPVAVPPVEPPPVALAPVEAPRVPVSATPPAPVFKELVDYWRSLRSGDDHPAAEAINRDLVTQRWPGTLLIAYTPASQDPRGELRPGGVTRLGTAAAETQSVVDAGSQATEWMLEVARTALINDEPVEEQQRLATVTGVAGFRMVALPLGPQKGLANAVLCVLAPNPGAPRFGKRRTWL
jgi:hypothetical protein